MTLNDRVLVRKGGAHFHTDAACKMVLRSSWDDRHTLVPRTEAADYEPCPLCSKEAASVDVSVGQARRR